MNIEDWTETTSEANAREERLRAAARRRRRRRTNVRAVLVLSGILLVLAVLITAGMMLYGRLAGEEAQGVMSLFERWKAEDGLEEDRDADGRENRAETPEVELPASADSIVYSEEELDRRVAEAVAEAQSAEADRVLEGIKAALSEGTTTVETLRPYYPDEIVVVSGGRFHFVPIDRQLKQNQLSAENLEILETGEYQYLTDGQVSSHKGIDVSSHQGDIDWELVAQDGVEFAIIRVGFRGYGTGKLVADERFDANIQGAIAAGIRVGVYFFSQAVTEEEALEEAALVLEKIQPYQLDCPVVFDVEKVSGSGRMNELSVEERTRLTVLFCETIEEAGYRPMVYYNTEMGALMLDLPQLEDYDKWYASYSDQMFYPYEYKIWQYSDKGRVQGISSDVDMNISFSPLWE